MLLRDCPGLRIAANYPDGLIEYYFETARTITDLTISQTIQNFTQLNFFASHCGGAFPAVEDRFLKTVPALEASSKPIYNSRYVPADISSGQIDNESI